MQNLYKYCVRCLLFFSVRSNLQNKAFEVIVETITDVPAQYVSTAQLFSSRASHPLSTYSANQTTAAVPLHSITVTSTSAKDEVSTSPILHTTMNPTLPIVDLSPFSDGNSRDNYLGFWIVLFISAGSSAFNLWV